MNIHLTKSQIGLDGVAAAETALSHVDGERGALIIAGEHVGRLAATSRFEGVTARLWNDWHWQLANRVRSIDRLATMLNLSDEEKAAGTGSGLPLSNSAASSEVMRAPL